MKKILLTLTCLITVCSYKLSSQDITEGLIGHWPLNGNANDSIGTNHGTTHNILFVQDKFLNSAGAVHFAGNSYITIPSIGNEVKISFSFWAKINQQQTSTPNVFIDYGSRRAIVNFTSDSEILRFWGYNSNGQAFWSQQPKDTLSLNTWHHVVATLDWENKVGSFYLDGNIIEKDVSITGTAPANGGSLILGSENGSQYYIKDGEMDDLKIYDRILSDSEVIQLYNYLPTSQTDESFWVQVNNGISFNSGNVGIGTTIPSNKLEVNGTIRSKKVKVEMTGWPDYVFAPSYKLRTLNELEQYVKANKHLPGVPAANEVEKEGLDLGAMDATLLKKVEELTLYLIDMKKEIDGLKKENKELKIEVGSLKTQTGKSH